MLCRDATTDPYVATESRSAKGAVNDQVTVNLKCSIVQRCNTGWRYRGG
jgi:hypothetical protein